MGLLSFFKRNASASAAKPVADTSDAVQQLRVRARRRLMGAALLVGIGVIAFPLLFETQPRPISVDLPIEIPRKENVAPLPMPELPKDSTAASGAITGAAEQAETLRTAEPAAPVAQKEVPAKIAKSVEKAPPKAVDKSSEKTSAKAKEVAGKDSENARALALLEGKAADAANHKRTEAAARFVVQVGAFAEAGSAQEARVRVEKLGLKTYTQVIDSSAGKRTRVRVGPFATREEADKASARIRASGLPAAILTL